jgi:hypothetical protein
VTGVEKPEESILAVEWLALLFHIWEIPAGCLIVLDFPRSLHANTKLHDGKYVSYNISAHARQFSTYVSCVKGLSE